jgi:hypothetical protein
MLGTISDHPSVAIALIVFLVAILGYFIKQVLSKIDEHALTISALKLELVTQLSSMRVNFKEDITVLFNDTCSERQGACSRLQQAKLDTMQATHQAICAKLSRLDSERKEAWGEQRRWNDKYEVEVKQIRAGCK